MTTTVPLLDWAEKRDRAMAQVQEHAGEAFMSRALKFCADYLKTHAEASGEEISAACVAAGIKPHDDRAFGPVMKALLKDKIIERCGYCLRKRGNGTGGGSIYKLRK